MEIQLYSRKFELTTSFIYLAWQWRLCFPEHKKLKYFIVKLFLQYLDFFAYIIVILF